MTLRRGFGVRPGERVLVVEDVITTGGSTRETCDALRAAGALVVGAASIIDRSGGRSDVGVPRVALATLEVPAVSPAECTLCAAGVPAVKPGSRKRRVGLASQPGIHRLPCDAANVGGNGRPANALSSLGATMAPRSFQRAASSGALTTS